MPPAGKSRSSPASSTEGAPLVYDEANDRWIIERRGHGSKRANALTTNDIFVRFVAWLFIILVLYGAGMTAVTLFGHYNLATRMLNGFSTMFAGILGLGSGYVLGKNRPNGKSPE